MSFQSHPIATASVLFNFRLGTSADVEVEYSNQLQAVSERNDTSRFDMEGVDVELPENGNFSFKACAQRSQQGCITET